MAALIGFESNRRLLTLRLGGGRGADKRATKESNAGEGLKCCSPRLTPVNRNQVATPTQ